MLEFISEYLNFSHIFFFFFFGDRERGKEGEREGEEHQCEREASISSLSHVSQPGTQLQPDQGPNLLPM